MLTGASGSGKTALVAALLGRRATAEAPGSGSIAFPVFDADDFIGRSRTTAERVSGLRAMLRVVRSSGRLCFCAGQIPPDELRALSDGEPEVSWLWLTVAEPQRTARLLAVGWAEEQIAEHRDWLDQVGFEASCRCVAALELDGTDASPNWLADQVASWISTNLEDNSVPNYAVWAAEAPQCESLHQLAVMVECNPQLDYADLYHPLPFGPFDRLRTAVDKAQFERKVADIGEAVARLAPPAPGRAPPRVIDIGANGGAVSIPLACAGYEVTAVEPDPSFLELGRRACALAGVPVEWVQGGLDQSLLPGRQFDVALVLSVFQWAAQGGNALEEAGRALRSLTDRCHSLVFELGFNAGTSCFRTDEADQAKVLLKMLIDYTGYSDFELLSASELYPGQVRFIYCCKGRRPRASGAG